jgi:flagellar motor switch protein FliG
MTVESPHGRLSPRRRAALLLYALDRELAAQVLRHLSETELGVLTRELVQLERLPAAEREVLLTQLYEDLVNEPFLIQDRDFVREILGLALGAQRAHELLSRVTMGEWERPFDFLRNLNPAQAAETLSAEHPQTIALALAHLPPETTVRILRHFDEDRRAEIVERMARMNRTVPEAIRKTVEQALRQRATQAVGAGPVIGGIDYVVKILTAMDVSTERKVLRTLEESDPELAQEIRQKMFVFEDLVLLDDRAIQRLLREVKMRDLALALKGASEGVRAKIFRNMSSRGAQALREEMEILGPQRLRVVEEAQQRIVNIVRQLEAAQQITIPRGQEEPFVS